MASLQDFWMSQLRDQFRLNSTANRDGTITVHDKDAITGESKDWTFTPRASDGSDATTGEGGGV